MKAELNFSVEEVVQTTIEVALADALNQKGGLVVKEIVRHALEEPAEKYSRETVLQASLKRAIRSIASDLLKSWVDANHASIAEMVAAQCREMLKPEFVAECCVSHLTTLTTSIKPFAKKSTKSAVDDEEEY